MATSERDYSDAKKLRIVVVGAGIVGASIAYHLSRRKDIAVTVLERDESCAGASGHSFAWLNSFGKDPVSYHHFNRRSMDIWDRFARRLGGDLDLHWGGELRWESMPERVEVLRQRVKQLQAWGYPIRIISSDELRELEPGLSPGPVEIASFSEIDGRVDPFKVIEACLQRACEAGASVHTHTPVTELCLDQRGKIKAVNTPSEEISCDVVVLASGTDTTELAATASVHIPQQHSPGVVVRTDPQPPILQNVSVLHLPPIDENRHEIHLRQSADGTLAIGQGSQESVDQDDSQEHADDLLGRAVHYLPTLVGARTIPIPVGYRPMPIDELPVIGFCDAAPNLYIALMHSGVTLAPLVGELATVEIVDGAHVEMLAPYRPERFRSANRTNLH
ncbi:FAD-binding oxidoreductase [Candidatus Poribacteria bacterium]|nr:FAD-binding oxidoreductase [Candidatus Poribacteria bacterium]